MSANWYSQLKEELPSLAEKGIQQLYETPPTTPSATDNHQDLGFILKKLAKSLLLNFMELIGIMGINPELVHNAPFGKQT